LYTAMTVLELSSWFPSRAGSEILASPYIHRPTFWEILGWKNLCTFSTRSWSL